MDEFEEEYIRDVIVSRSRRRLWSGSFIAILLSPFLVVLLHTRATAIYLSGLESRGELFYDEGFEYLLMAPYTFFGLIGLIWSAIIFLSSDKWEVKQLQWQLWVIFFLCCIPALTVLAFFIFIWPPVG